MVPPTSDLKTMNIHEFVDPSTLWGTPRSYLLMPKYAVDVHDVPVDFVLLEALQSFPGRDAQPQDVRVEHFPQVFEANVGKVAVGDDARVVDEDVDRAQVLLDPPETLDDFLLLGDVRLDGVNFVGFVEGAGEYFDFYFAASKTCHLENKFSLKVELWSKYWQYKKTFDSASAPL